MQGKTKAFATLSVAAVMATSLAAPVAAQTSRQRDKNTMRNLGAGLGAAAVVEALRGNNTTAIILGAGAAYSAKRYEDARSAQRRESSRRRMYRAKDFGPIDVFLNNKAVAFTNQRPQMVAGNVYVPLRGVLEKMGAHVEWNPRARAVIAAHGNKLVRLPENGTATVNGQAVTLDTPAFIANGQTMIPLRFMAEAFGADVTWDPEDRDVHIKSSTTVSSNDR